MRWIGTALALGVLTLVDPGAGGSSAWAVIDGPAAPKAAAVPPAVAPPQPSTPADASAYRLDLPIAWQLTRARTAGSGTTTVTESFRETWSVEQRPGGILFLKSPRARVPAYLPGGNPGKNVALPAVVLVSEEDFARLLGIHVAEPFGDDVATSAAAAGSPLALPLSKPPRGGTDVTLAWSEDEHFAVHIDVGGTNLF